MLPRELHDFRNFLYLAWECIGLPEPTPVQYDMAYYMQHGPDPTKKPWEAPNNRIILTGFRGVGKSFIGAAFTMHQTAMDPKTQVLSVSASKDKSDNFTTFCKRLLMDMPILDFLVPRNPQRWSNTAFDVEGAPASQVASVRSCGIFGQITGGRADLILPDDVEVPNTAETQVMRDKLGMRVQEFESIIKPKGRTVYLGTPHFEDSLYNVLPTRGYSKRIWPARYPADDKIAGYDGYLAPKIAEELEKEPELVGEPTDPLRFNEVDLQEREAAYARSGFALQFMLDTSLSDRARYPLRLNDIIVRNVDPEVAPEKILWGPSKTNRLPDLPNLGLPKDYFVGPDAVVSSEDYGFAKYTQRVMAIDPSGRGKDETTWATGLFLNGHIHVPLVGWSNEGYDPSVLLQIALAAKEWRVNAIVIESNFGDGMFEKLLAPVLRKHHPCKIEEVRHSRMKEMRIADTLEPIMNQHKLILDPKVIQRDYDSLQDRGTPETRMKYSLIYQLSRLQRVPGCLSHDDRLDVLAILCAFFVEAMGQDADEQMIQREQFELHKEIDEFLGSFSSGRTNRPNSNSALRGNKRNR
jgi:hypothetical protein